MMEYKKRKFVLLLLILLFAAEISLHSDVRTSFAASRPSSAGTGWYVQNRYHNQVPWGGGTAMAAYRKAFSTNPGGPNPTIVLDFGRQDIRNGVWGNVPVAGTWQTSTWVREVAQNFINGYTDNPSHPHARIVIGTNNSNYPWPCEEVYPYRVDYIWYQSGYAWASFIQTLASTSKVDIVSGNDFESWIDHPEFYPWRSCGQGSVNWLTGYEQRWRDTQQQKRPNYNYGNKAYSQDRNEWSQFEQYEVSWGMDSAYGLPEIYCQASPNDPESWANGWVTLRRLYPLNIEGVLSDDAGSRACGSVSLAWWASWDTLSNALSTAGYPYTLYSLSVAMQQPGN